MMRTRLAYAVAALVLLVACTTPQLASRVDRNWGSAQRDNTEAMVANPAGTEVGHDPADPMDGKTVEAAVGTHRQRQKRAAPAQPKSIINIGTVGR